MIISLEVAFVICMKAKHRDGVDYVPRSEIINHFGCKKKKLESAMDDGDGIERIERKLERNEEIIKKLKQIDDWESFFDKIIDGDFCLAGSSHKFGGRGE